MRLLKQGQRFCTTLGAPPQKRGHGAGGRLQGHVQLSPWRCDAWSWGHRRVLPDASAPAIRPRECKRRLADQGEEGMRVKWSSIQPGQRPRELVGELESCGGSAGLGSLFTARPRGDCGDERVEECRVGVGKTVGRRGRGSEDRGERLWRGAVNRFPAAGALMRNRGAYSWSPDARRDWCVEGSVSGARWGRRVVYANRRAVWRRGYGCEAQSSGECQRT